MRPHHRLETIIASLDDALAAATAGADRFELCSGLALGGLTPSLGLLRAVKKETATPVMCMIRPREGGMHYSDAEFRTMLEDAELALQAGADGLVFGFLTDQGGIDARRCRDFLRLVERGAPKPVQTVFHRAYDIVANPDQALEQLIDLGVTRVLTSGRAPDALSGAAEIRRTIERANGRIEVLPGGGIKLENLEQVLARTGADQVHVYLTHPRMDRSASFNPSIHFAAQTPPDELHHLEVDGEQVRLAKGILESASPTP